MVFRPLCALVGNAQQRLGSLAGARVQIGRHRLILGQRGLVQRVQTIGEIVEQTVYDFGNEPRLDRLDRAVCKLDGHAHQALRGDLFFDDLFAIDHHLLAGCGWT